MKKLSIKLKVTMWFSTILLVIVILVMALLLVISNHQIIATARLRMEQLVNDSMEKIEQIEGTLNIESDLDYFQDGIYLSIYDEEARFLYGRIPHNFENIIGLRQGLVQEVEQGDRKWFIYDGMMTVDGFGEVWIRGIMPQAEVTSAISYMVKPAFFVLPFIVLLAAATGYLLTKRAFSPIKQIGETAKKISVENDLSKRINLGEGNDEVYQLADTFDIMLARLEEAFEKEKQFTSDASHELRTPISVIISECEYAIENDSSSEELRDSLAVVLSHSKKMAGLISQLLMLARTDQNKQQLDLEEVNLSEVVEMVIAEQQLIANKRNIQIEFKTESGLCIEGDETLLMRAFINLISNAIKYGKEQGRIMVEMTKEEDQIKGYIRDDGIGIAKTHLDKIWNRFYQADSSRSSKREGIGLGLAMVKWIIEAHDGTIAVESVLNEGTVFYFTLPEKQQKNIKR